jgi:hypothetical protein
MRWLWLWPDAIDRVEGSRVWVVMWRHPFGVVGDTNTLSRTVDWRKQCAPFVCGLVLGGYVIPAAPHRVQQGETRGGIACSTSSTPSSG